MTTIENRRFALLLAIGMVGFLLYQDWQKEHQATATPPAAEASGAAAAVAPGNSPAPTPVAPEAGVAAASADAATQRVRVETDLVRAEISLLGGDLRRVELKGYPVAKREPDVNVALVDDREDHWFVIQSGLLGAQQPVVSHNDVFKAAAPRYVLADGSESVDVPLTFADAGGHRVTKTYRFHRGSYVVDLSQQLANDADAPLAASAYVQLWRTPTAVGEEPPFAKPFMGLGFYEQKDAASYRFRKLTFKDLTGEPLEAHQTGGWVAMLQHYFFAAVIPPAAEPATFIAKPNATRGFVAQYIGGAHEVPAHGQAQFDARLYVGPTLQAVLPSIAPGIELVSDYGVLKFIAQPLFLLLAWYHGLTHNWGFAIILLTLTVRGALFKLSEAQYRSMARMRKFAPRIQELKDRYADDRQRLNQAMMELYKKEKFNPLAGCWPLLIQMPVFFALYWVLQQSVELRQADFALWLHDLSSPDPYYVLPVLFGATMFVQQKLSGNVVADPMQQRVMNAMPFMMTVFFAFFPAGLVLYWFVSNLIAIAQQWVILQRLTREGLRH